VRRINLHLYNVLLCLVVMAFNATTLIYASDATYPVAPNARNTQPYSDAATPYPQNTQGSANRGAGAYTTPSEQGNMGGQSSGNVRFGRTATGFVYDAMAPMRYEQLKLAWLNQHPGETPTPGDMENLAHASFLTQHSDTPLWKEITHWRMVGEPHPWHIVPRIQLENASTAEAALGLRIGVKVLGNYGVWYPENKGAITDVHRLQRNPERHLITEYTVPVEGLATRDYLLKELKPIDLMPILKARPDRFPNTLHVELRLLQDGRLLDTQSLRLQLYPDVFALPIYLY
jgi:hypothetical protein